MDSFAKNSTNDKGFILVSLTDKEILDIGWFIDSRGYVAKKINYRNVRLHRMVMNANKGQIVDHINGNKLDNRRENLRFCTKQENCRNVHARRNKYNFKGISKNGNRFMAQIRLSGKLKYLGSFNTPILAAEAYDKAALLYFREFANTNGVYDG